MAEEFTKYPPGEDEFLREEGTQKIILSEKESHEEIAVPAPRPGLASLGDFSSKVGASLVDLFRWLSGSKVGLSIAAGLFAAFMAAIGFAVFDVGREQWMLEQRYPDAVSVDERYLFYARDLMDRDQYADAQDVLQDLLERSTGDVLRADAQFLLGTCVLKSATDMPSASAGRTVFDKFVKEFPTDRRVPVAHRLVAESLAKSELYDESTVRCKRLLRMLPEGHEKGEVELLIAKNFCDADNLTSARTALHELREKYAGTPIAYDATIMLGEMMIKYRRFDAAEALLQELVRRAPGTAHAAKAILMLAEAAVERGEYERAIGYCEDWFKYSRTSQDEVEILLLLAEAKLETGAPQEAISLASEIIMSYPSSPRLARAGMLMGRAYEAMNDLERAENYYHIAAEMDPTNWRPHWRLARLRISQGNWKEAIELMQHAIDLAPDEDFLLLELTKLYQHRGDEATAIAILDTFTHERQLSPRIDEAFLILVDMHLKRGALQDAYNALERLQSVDATATDLPEIYDREGDILYEVGLYDDALKKYRAAVEKGADRETGTLKIAHALLASGKPQACLEELAGIESAVRPADKRFDLFDLKAQALTKLERYAEARAAILKAIDLRSGRENFSTLASLMQVNLELGDDDAASDIYELTLKLIDTGDSERQVRSGQRYIMLGWARRLYNIGDYARAAEVYSRIGTMEFPLADAAWALYQQGNCYFHMADYDKASEFYARLAAEFNDSEWVQYARAKQRLISAGAGS